MMLLIFFHSNVPQALLSLLVSHCELTHQLVNTALALQNFLVVIQNSQVIEPMMSHLLSSVSLDQMCESEASLTGHSVGRTSHGKSQ